MSKNLPFAIPESLASYVIQFQTAEDKTISRLQKQLDRRGPDPVGYFLLGWFYYCKKMHDEAISCALKAKNFAPGSPFLERLHYFFSHPDLFGAWQMPETDASGQHKTIPIFNGAVADLDLLIEKLAQVERSKQKKRKINPADLEMSPEEESDLVAEDDVASETLAKIHEKQGKIGQALKIYKRLMMAKGDVEEEDDYYSVQVARLQRLKDKQDADSST